MGDPISEKANDLGQNWPQGKAIHSEEDNIHHYANSLSSASNYIKQNSRPKSTYMGDLIAEKAKDLGQNWPQGKGIHFCYTHLMGLMGLMAHPRRELPTAAIWSDRWMMSLTWQVHDVIQWWQPLLTGPADDVTCWCNQMKFSSQEHPIFDGTRLGPHPSLLPSHLWSETFFGRPLYLI